MAFVAALAAGSAMAFLATALRFRFIIPVSRGRFMTVATVFRQLGFKVLDSCLQAFYLTEQMLDDRRLQPDHLSGLFK